MMQSNLGNDGSNCAAGINELANGNESLVRFLEADPDRHMFALAFQAHGGIPSRIGFRNDDDGEVRVQSATYFVGTMAHISVDKGFDAYDELVDDILREKPDTDLISTNCVSEALTRLLESRGLLLKDKEPMIMQPFKLSDPGPSCFAAPDLLDGSFEIISEQHLERTTEMLSDFYSHPMVRMANTNLERVVMMSERRAAELLQNKSGIVFRSPDGTTNGLVSWTPPFPIKGKPCARITCLYFAPCTRGKGLAKPLLARACQFLFATAQIDTLYLFANQAYPVTMNLYKSFGFSPFEPLSATFGICKQL